MFFGRRKRLTKIEKAEAQGRSFWTQEVDQQARIKLVYAVQTLTAEKTQYSGWVNLVGVAQRLTLEDLGLPRLSKSGPSDPSEDGLQAILDAEESVVFSLIEALLSLSWQVRSRFPGIHAQTLGDFQQGIPKFVRRVRTILREHRVSFDLIDGKFMPRESLEMHESVVVPTLTLLGGREGFEKVEKAYQDSLRELHTGTPEDAITDAATALQESLVALGGQGNSLGLLTRCPSHRGGLQVG